MAGWQPIETAPRDGTPVRVGFFRDWVFETSDGKPQNWHAFGWYNEKDKFGSSGSWKVYRRDEKSLQNFSWPPTHWMPVTETPTAR